MATRAKRTRRATDPDGNNFRGKRGRRGHKAVDEQKVGGVLLRDWLIEQLQIVPKPTLPELMEKLKGTGFSVGRTAVWEFTVAWQKLLAERDLALRQAQEYAALDNDQPLNVEAAISTMGGIAILTDLRTRLEDANGKVNEDIQQLLTLAARMQLSAAQRERTKNGIERGVARAMRRMTADMEETLRGYPDALKVFLAAARKAATKETAR